MNNFFILDSNFIFGGSIYGDSILFIFVNIENSQIYKMSIEIVSGTTQIKCIPHKKKNKKDNLKILSIYKNSTKKLNNNSQIKKIDKDEDDIFLFNNFNIYEEYDEPENNKFYNYLDDEENVIRNHLFLGKKKFL